MKLTIKVNFPVAPDRKTEICRSAEQIVDGKTKKHALLVEFLDLPREGLFINGSNDPVGVYLDICKELWEKEVQSLVPWDRVVINFNNGRANGLGRTVAFKDDPHEKASKKH